MVVQEVIPSGRIRVVQVGKNVAVPETVDFKILYHLPGR